MPVEKIKQNTELIQRVEQFLQTGYSANKEFNAYFSGNDPVVINSLKDIGQEYHYDASELLYWVDRDTYFDELDRWCGGKIKEEHSEAIDFLTTSNQQAVFSDLVELIRRQRVAPFVGAGMSKAAGYPLWSEALGRLGESIAAVDEDVVRQLIAENRYLDAAQKVSQASEYQLINYIQTTFRTRYENDEEREKIPQIFKLLPRLSSGCIVTTNFDCLIEETFRAKNAPLVDGYMHGVQQGHNFVQRLLKADRCILKLHGDASQPGTYVFTEEQYKTAYGDCAIDYSKQLPKALRQIYISNSLLFLGCSLAEDKTLALFKDVKDGQQFEIPDHFAIISEPEDVTNKQATEDRLLDIKIRPIWYRSDNYHEMATRLVELAVDIADRRISLG
jgi:SIR2-like domain